MEIPALADLLDVQALDLEIDRLLARRSGMPELQLYKSTQERIDGVSAQIEAAAADLRQVELDTDKAEGELELIELKLNEQETRLFAGGMSARETEHMRLEVQSLRGQMGASEERVLGLLELLEPAQSALAALQAERDELADQKAELESVITAAWREIDAELARKEERKVEALEPVPADLVEMYDKLRPAKEGVAISRLENSTCGGCHMILSPAEVSIAKESDPARCVHCRRILVI